MSAITHDLGQLPPRVRERVQSWEAGLRRFLLRLSATVERDATRNLSGGGPAGAYPVPRRSGNLARSMGSEVGRRHAVVFNSAEYARSVHEGFRAYGNPNAPYYGPRRYLADAAQVDAAAMLLQEMELSL